MTKRKPKKDKIKIIQPEEGPEMGLEIIAEHIRRISEMGRQINGSRLKRRAICLLLKDVTNIAMSDIDKILTALPRLEDEFIK